MADSRRFAVLFDEEALAEDRDHASPAGRRVLDRERGRVERQGLRPDELTRCQPHARDGTRLAGCVKTYLPQPDGQWGLVLRGWDREGPGLLCVAFGMRHPEQAWRPSVYQVAHRRLHGSG